MARAQMTISKENNQYYGEAFERCIVAFGNNTSVLEEFNNIQFIFPKDHINIIINDAKRAFSLIKNSNNINQSAPFIYIGRHTSKASGDIQVGDKIIEVKYVGGDSGTWSNNSINYFKDFDCGIDFLNTYRQYNYSYEIEQVFKRYNIPVKISHTNNSPVNQKDASMIRHQYPDAYNFIREIEKLYREKCLLMQDEYFQIHPEKQRQFILDSLSKTGARKTIPHKLLVFRRNEDKCYLINTEYLLNEINHSEMNLIRKTNGDSYICDNMRMTIAWQNTTGLNNFSIRTFLTKEFLDKYARIG